MTWLESDLSTQFKYWGLRHYLNGLVHGPTVISRINTNADGGDLDDADIYFCVWLDTEQDYLSFCCSVVACFMNRNITGILGWLGIESLDWANERAKYQQVSAGCINSDRNDARSIMTPWAIKQTGTFQSSQFYTLIWNVFSKWIWDIKQPEKMVIALHSPLLVGLTWPVPSWHICCSDAKT